MRVALLDYEDLESYKLSDETFRFIGFLLYKSDFKSAG